MSGDLIIGGITAVTMGVSTQFLDYTKVLAQVHSTNHPVANLRPLLSARQDISAHGFKQMWVGYEAMAYRSFIYLYIRGSIYTSLFETKASTDRYHSVSTMNKTFFSIVAGAVGGFLANPFDLILLRKQVDHTLENPRGYTTTIDAVKKIAAEGNLNKLWTGSVANSAKYGMLAFGMFPVFESMAEFLPRIWGEVFFSKYMAIAAASVVGAFTSMPFDNVKTKLQRQVNGGEYKNFTDCFIKTMARENFLGAYVGFWFYAFRIFLMSSGTVIMVDSLRRFNSR